MVCFLNKVRQLALSEKIAQFPHIANVCRLRPSSGHSLVLGLLDLRPWTNRFERFLVPRTAQGSVRDDKFSFPVPNPEICFQGMHLGDSYMDIHENEHITCRITNGQHHYPAPGSQKYDAKKNCSQEVVPPPLACVFISRILSFNLRVYYQASVSNPLKKPCHVSLLKIGCRSHLSMPA